MYTCCLMRRTTCRCVSGTCILEKRFCVETPSEKHGHQANCCYFCFRLRWQFFSLRLFFKGGMPLKFNLRAGMLYVAALDDRFS